MLLAESPFATQIRADVASIRTLLVTLFFSSIGMLGDPSWFLHHLPSVGALVAAIVIGKALVIWLVLNRFGVPHTNALAAGICLGQVGEFSFVLAAVGRESIISEDLFALLISATITTLFLTPYLIAGAPHLANAVVGTFAKLKWLPAPANPSHNEPPPSGDGIIVIGFGPAGQAVAQALAGLPNPVTIIDLNPEMFPRAHELGLTAHLGDAMHADVLEHAGIATSAAVVVTIPDPAGARSIVALIRSIAPQVHIIARGRYHRFLHDLQAGGADEVVDEEKIVGTRLAAHMRRRLRLR
jgi:CPA2 family monovalent cation:H+ antiporter-2